MKTAILCFILCMSSIFAAEDKDATKRKVLNTLIISSWASIGITEGLKWKHDRTGNIDLFWKEDYHLYRTVTNWNFIAIPVLAITMEPSKENIKQAVISNIVGWVVYESIICMILNGNIYGPREEFRILGASFEKPSPTTLIPIAAITSIEFYYSF